MKFTQIPEAHSSFCDPLIYAFDSEAAANDVELKIINADTGEVIGRKKLYGITQGEVDIAPTSVVRCRPSFPRRWMAVAWWSAGCSSG